MAMDDNETLGKILRAKNYGEKVTLEHMDILVALDLLCPQHDDATRREVIDKRRGGNPMVRYERYHRQGGHVGGIASSHRFEIRRNLVEELLRHNLVAPRRYGNTESTTEFLSTDLGLKTLNRLLAEHDRMHGGDSLMIRPGSYVRPNRPTESCRVFYVAEGTDEEVGNLRVIYDVNHGAKKERPLHSPLHVFTRVIYDERANVVSHQWVLPDHQ